MREREGERERQREREGGGEGGRERERVRGIKTVLFFIVSVSLLSGDKVPTPANEGAVTWGSYTNRVQKPRGREEGIFHLASNMS